MKKHKPSKPLLGPVATKFSTERTGTWRTKHPVVSHAECVRCGICSEYCPTGVIHVPPVGDNSLMIDLDNCKGCGICANLCPRSCIEMVNEGKIYA